MGWPWRRKAELDEMRAANLALASDLEGLRERVDRNHAHVHDETCRLDREQTASRKRLAGCLDSDILKVSARMDGADREWSLVAKLLQGLRRRVEALETAPAADSMRLGCLSQDMARLEGRHNDLAKSLGERVDDLEAALAADRGRD